MSEVVEVVQRSVIIDVLEQPTSTVVEVIEAGPEGPPGPVADLDLIEQYVDVAVQDYFVLHPNTYTVDHPTETYVWDDVHPLDHLPAATVIDSAGTEVVGVTTWPAPNRVRTEFNTPQAGKHVLT